MWRKKKATSGGGTKEGPLAQEALKGLRWLVNCSTFRGDINAIVPWSLTCCVRVLVQTFLGLALSPGRCLWQKAVQVEKVEGMNIEWELDFKNSKQCLPYHRKAKKKSH